MSTRIPELLAPAGSAAALHAAVRAGADAVYLGLGAFNARRNADNFTYETFEQACEYAHLRGVNIYVTMNTIILPHELNDALETARQAYRLGADAFIVQDIGLASRIADTLGDARLHISTQMNIHSADGVAMAAGLGAKRITLSRELTLEEIKHLTHTAADLNVETEVFAHGAICICYSGQCLLSSMIGGRSANRGLCAQACRLPYELICKEKGGRALDNPGEFLLSPKDMCTIDDLHDLIATGVASLKIEGRMKSPEYVASAVAAYREALDLISRGMHVDSEEAKDKLESVFSRGFTSGYLHGESGNALMGYKRPNNRGRFIGRIKSIDGEALTIACDVPLCIGDALEIWTRRGNVISEVVSVEQGEGQAKIELAKETHKIKQSDRVFRVRSASAAFEDDPYLPKIPVNGVVKLKIGEPLSVEFSLACDPDITGRSESDIVEAARTKAVNEQDVIDHIDRLGNTHFAIDDIKIELDDGVGIGFSKLHHARADALDDLKLKMLARYAKRSLSKMSKATRTRPDVDMTCSISVLVTNPECARAAKRAGANAIYVPALNYKRGTAMMQGRSVKDASQAGYPKHCILEMPSIDHDAVGASKESKVGIDLWEFVDASQPVLVESLASLGRALEMGAYPEVGPSLPITNRASLDLVSKLGVRRVWLSPELNLSQIEELAQDSPVALGMKISGAQELMVTEHCLLASQGECAHICAVCQRRERRHVLKDRKGYEFPVITDEFGRSHLFNSVPLDAVSLLPDLVVSGVTSFMVDATLLDVEQTAQAVGRAVHGLKLAMSGQGSLKKLPDTTLGHLHRGVL